MGIKSVCGVFILFLLLHFSPSLAKLTKENLSLISHTEGTIIHDVLPDRLGNIWMCTQNGLVSYDGYELSHHFPDPKDSSSIRSIMNYRLFEDSSGNIWIGSMGGFSIYNPLSMSFKNFSLNHLTGLSNGSQAVPLSFAEDSEGRVYLGLKLAARDGNSSSLFYFDTKRQVIEAIENKTDQKPGSILDLRTDSSGNLWILGEQGIYKLDSRLSCTGLALPLNDQPGESAPFTAMLCDDEGKLWLLNRKWELYQYQDGKGYLNSWSLQRDYQEESLNMEVKKMEFDPQGNIWIASTGGIMIFNIAEGRFEKQNLKEVLRSEETEVYSIRVDLFDDIWIGTRSNGLLRYNNHAIFKALIPDENDPQALQHGWSSRLTRDSEGKIWIITSGTQAFSLHVFDPSTAKLKSLPLSTLSPGGKHIEAMMEARPGEFLIASKEEFLWYHIETNTLKEIKYDSLVKKELSVYSLFKDKQGELWICTQKGVYSPGHERKAFKHIDLLSVKGATEKSRAVKLVRESIYNGLWLLTDDGLFFYSHDSERTERHGYDESSGDIFMAQGINSLHEDKSGMLWVGTWQGGLSSYNPETGFIKTYTSNDGLPSMSIQGIEAGMDDHILWISTFDGLSRFHKEEETFHNFSMADGIHGHLFAEGASLKTPDGLLVFGGNNGLTYFQPGDISKYSKPPLTYITDVRIANQSTSEIADFEPGSKNFKLSFHQNDISIHYTGIQHANPEKNRFAYKLENYDDKWREVGNVRTAYYYGLPPGKYVFHLKAANGNGVWTDDQEALNFHILPPWWLRWWFFSTVFLLIILAFIRIRRYEIRRIKLANELLFEKKEADRLKAMDQTKSNFFANISHEFRTPLTVILGQISLAKEQLTAAGGRGLDIAYSNAEKLLKLVNQLLDLSRLEAGSTRIQSKEENIIPFLKNQLFSLESLSAQKSIRLEFHSEVKSCMVRFDENLMDKVFANLLSNAIKFTPGSGLVRMDVRKVSEGKVKITISDTGPGIPEESLNKVFERFYQLDDSMSRRHEGSGIGLSLAKEFVLLHKGAIFAESEPGKGASFNVLLPVLSWEAGTENFQADNPEASIELLSDTSFSENTLSDVTEIPAALQKEAAVILVVEDNRDVRDYLKQCLNSRYHTMEAENGAVGLKLASEYIPDLIVSDVMMPEMDGMSFSKKIRESEFTCHIPIIMLTARSSDQDRLDGLKTGVDDFLTKPFNKNQLLARIENLLKMRKLLQKQYAGENIIRPSEIEVTSMDQEFLKKVLVYIEQQLGDESLSVERVASSVSMSESQLNRKLKAITGTPPGQLIRSMRLHRAAEMLQKHSGTVSEIAFECGFGDLANFTRSFKREYHIAPSKYAESKAV